MIECKDIEYMLAIYQNGSIKRAAQELFISQPALTNYIKALEGRLNVTLFNRRGKTISLTPAGKLYMDYAVKISSLLGQLNMEMQLMGNKQLNDLNVAISTSSLREVITEAIMQFVTKFPRLNTQLKEFSSYDIEEAVVQRKAHIGFMTLPCLNPALDTEIISDTYLLLGVSKNNPLSMLGKTINGCPYQWMDLKHFQGEPMCLPGEGTRTRMIVDELFEEAGVEPNVIVTACSQITSLSLAQHTDLSFFSSESFIQQDLMTRRIRYFVVGTPLRTSTIAAIYRKDIPLSPVARQLLDEVKTLIKEQRLQGRILPFQSE